MAKEPKARKWKEPEARKWSVAPGPVSKTIQSHAQGNTVPEIVNRFRLSGTKPEPLLPGQFFDVSALPNLLEALNVGAKFNSYFSMLPALTRDWFRNDPKRLMVALNDPAQQAKLIELGILSAPPKVAPPLGSKENPIVTKVVPDPAALPAPPGSPPKV